MKTSRAILVLAFILAFVVGVSAQQAPLKLSHTTPLPELKDGDFDHLLADVAGNRLFATAEENSKVSPQKLPYLMHASFDPNDVGEEKLEDYTAKASQAGTQARQARDFPQLGGSPVQAWLREIPQNSQVAGRGVGSGIVPVVTVSERLSSPSSTGGR